MRLVLPRGAWLAALLVAAPLALHWPALTSGGAIPGSAMGDTLRGHWTAWLVAHTLPAWPFSPTAAAFPDGVDLLPLPPLSLVIVAPVTRLLGPELGLTALVMLHTALAALGGALLARALGSGRGGALLAGATLAVQPGLAETLQLGIYEYQTIGWTALMLAALAATCRGRWRWGPIAGLLYVIAALECGYYGSAAALAALAAVLALTRSWRGALGALLAAIGVAAAALLAWTLFEAVLADLLTPPERGTASRSNRQVMAVAELLAPLDPNTWVTRTTAPPALHWFAGALGAALCLRRSAWLAALAAAFALLAIGSPAMTWWNETPLGAPVAHVRRYIVPAGMCLAVCVGLGWSRLARRVRLPVGAAAMAALVLFDAGRGAWASYPLLVPPADPGFVAPIASDEDDVAVVVLPQEAPEGRGPRPTTHQRLDRKADFSNPQARLWIQTRLDKAMRHTPTLGTLRRRVPRDLRLDRDPARGGVLDRRELERLRAQGLRYLLLAHAQLGPQGLSRLQTDLARVGADCTEYPDWDGVSLCRLGAEQPGLHSPHPSRPQTPQPQTPQPQTPQPHAP